MVAENKIRMTKLINVKFKLKSDVSVLDWEDDLNTRFLLVKNQGHIQSLTVLERGGGGRNIIIGGKITLETHIFFLCAPPFLLSLYSK